MSTSRLAKRIARRVTVSWRAQPTQRDIEALADNVRRVGMVIRFRWVMVVALTAFSFFAASIYALDSGIPRSQLLANMIVPAIALVFVLGYNTFYQATYRRLGNIAFLNHAQLLFDIIVISVLVYYSGGVYSWFYNMYALIVLEAAFIFPRGRDTWIVAGFAAASYGLVLGLDYVGALPHMTMPFVSNDLEHVAAYVAVRYLWGLTLIVGTAMVSTLIMASLRQRERTLTEETSVDRTTGLRDRHYFQRHLTAEVERARLSGRRLAILVADIDRFDEFNRTFGFEAGDRILHEVAGVVDSVIHTSGTSGADLNVVTRYGGEEFGAILPETQAPTGDGERTAEVRRLAESVREAVGALRVEDAGVTVSVGIALYPEDGRTAGELIAAADQALFSAMSAGGNRVASADSIASPSPAEKETYA